VPGEFEARENDLTAQALSHARLPGAPEFRLYWPRSRRTAAIEDWITFLEAQGDRLLEKFNQAESYPPNRKRWIVRRSSS
jgi:hypothetical protein